MIYPHSANMKILRAEEHFKTLQEAITEWLNLPPYVVSSYEYEDRGIYFCRIDLNILDNPIPKILGDFICNLRSSLDHLAWDMAHLPPKRPFTKKQLRDICFPVFSQNDSTYQRVRDLLPPAAADDLNSLQPYNAGAAFPDHPLWQLHELWKLDKHRAIPVAPVSMILKFPEYGVEYRGRMRKFYDHLEVFFPLSVVRNCPVKFEPHVTIDVTFGEDGGLLVSWTRLCEIYDFVRNEVIPRFARFFS